MRIRERERERKRDRTKFEEKKKEIRREEREEEKEKLVAVGEVRRNEETLGLEEEAKNEKGDRKNRDQDLRRRFIKGNKKGEWNREKSKEMDQVLELVKDQCSKCVHLKERERKGEREDESGKEQNWKELNEYTGVREELKVEERKKEEKSE